MLGCSQGFYLGPPRPLVSLFVSPDPHWQESSHRAQSFPQESRARRQRSMAQPQGLRPRFTIDHRVILWHQPHFRVGKPSLLLGVESSDHRLGDLAHFSPAKSVASIVPRLLPEKAEVRKSPNGNICTLSEGLCYRACRPQPPHVHTR